jgi:hypothetical protein
MPDRLLDSALDPDALLAKLDELERQRAQRSDDARLPAETYRQIRAALTDPALRAQTPRANLVGGPAVSPSAADAPRPAHPAALSACRSSSREWMASFM